MPKPDLKVQKAASFLQCPFVAEEIAEALSSTCREVLDLREAPGTIIPYHSHPEDKTIVVLEGVLRLNVEERLTVVEEGDVAIIRANAIHAYASIGKNPARILIGLSGSF